jgi:hypothetical protein
VVETCGQPSSAISRRRVDTPRRRRRRSREGLASREGRADIACFVVPSSGAGPEWFFGRAEFTARDEVAVYTQDGTMSRIRVDPGPCPPPSRSTAAPAPPTSSATKACETGLRR